MGSVQNIRTGNQLYKLLVKEAQKFPNATEKFTLLSYKQHYNLHARDTDQQKLEKVINRALEDVVWLKNKYKL